MLYTRTYWDPTLFPSQHHNNSLKIIHRCAVLRANIITWVTWYHDCQISLITRIMRMMNSDRDILMPKEYTRNNPSHPSHPLTTKSILTQSQSPSRHVIIITITPVCTVPCTLSLRTTVHHLISPHLTSLSLSPHHSSNQLSSWTNTIPIPTQQLNNNSQLTAHSHLCDVSQPSQPACMLQ
jgi:hypothetical protein